MYWFILLDYIRKSMGFGGLFVKKYNVIWSNMKMPNLINEFWHVYLGNLHEGSAKCHDVTASCIPKKFRTSHKICMMYWYTSSYSPLNMYQLWFRGFFFSIFWWKTEIKFETITKKCSSMYLLLLPWLESTKVSLQMMEDTSCNVLLKLLTKI